jgi:acyl carrier protein
MSDNDKRLIRCFSAVFPELTPEEICLTSAESLGNWDSLSAVKLAAVIQEEFNLEIDSSVLPDLDSFEAFRTYLSGISPTVE